MLGSATAETSALALPEHWVTEVCQARLGVQGRAAAAGATPGGLGPAPGGAGGLAQAGATDGDDGAERGRRLDAVAGVTGRGGHRDAGVVVGRGAGAVTAAVAVADRDHAGLAGGVVDRGAQVGERGGTRLDQQDLAVRAGGRDHVEVQADLGGPAGVGLGQAGGAAGLAHLAEAAVGGGAGREAELRAVDAEVGLGGRVVVGVDDGDGAAAAGGRGQGVGGADVGRVQAGRGTGDRRLALAVDDDLRVAGRRSPWPARRRRWRRAGPAVRRSGYSRMRYPRSKARQLRRRHRPRRACWKASLNLQGNGGGERDDRSGIAECRSHAHSG